MSRRVVVQRRVPLGQVVQRGIDATVAEYRAGGALVGALPAAVDLAVAIRALRHVVHAVLVGDGVRHAQRLEDPLLQELAKSWPAPWPPPAPAAHSRCCCTGTGCRGRTRAVLGSSRCSTRCRAPAGTRSGHQVFVVEQAAGMAEQLAQGDRVGGGRQRRQPALERVVQAQRPSSASSRTAAAVNCLLTEARRKLLRASRRCRLRPRPARSRAGIPAGRRAAPAPPRPAPGRRSAASAHRCLGPAATAPAPPSRRPPPAGPARPGAGHQPAAVTPAIRRLHGRLRARVRGSRRAPGCRPFRPRSSGVILASRISSGIEPSRSTSSWKRRRSKRGPSAALARSRSSHHLQFAQAIGQGLPGQGHEAFHFRSGIFGGMSAVLTR